MDTTLELMQRFMLKKGLINKPMTATQMRELMEEEDDAPDLPLVSEPSNSNDNNTRKVKDRRDNRGKFTQVDNEISYKSPSDVTIYQHAVELVNPQNCSGSSDDLINTSDETDQTSPIGEQNSKQLSSFPLIGSGHADRRSSGDGERFRSRSRSRSCSREERHRRRHDDRDRHDHSRLRSARERAYERGRQMNDLLPRQPQPPPETTPEEHAQRIIREAEQGRADMHKVKGNDQSLIDFNKLNNKVLLHSVLIDESYLVVAAHVDEQLKKRILDFEYVDFSKLLPHDRVIQEEDKRLTFMNKDGIPYLVPANEPGSSVGIHSYGKWDQAFRVYSDIVTSRFPDKAQELIQYNHSIHTATQTFIWENVYLYDKDFRIHISRNPTRSWSVILQQAWSMRLKDKHGSGHSRNSDREHGGVSSGSSGKSKDYCRRYQRGQCNRGLSCHYQHKCAICGKFGHGAHICRRRSKGNAESTDEKFHYYSDKSDRNGGGGYHQHKSQQQQQRHHYKDNKTSTN